MLDPWITYQRFLANDFWFFVTLFPFNHLAILSWLLLTIHAAFHLMMISVILASLWYKVRFPNPNLSDMHHLHLVWKFYSCLTSESSRCSPLFHRLGFIIPKLRSKTNPQCIQYEKSTEHDEKSNILQIWSTLFTTPPEGEIFHLTSFSVSQVTVGTTNFTLFFTFNKVLTTQAD